MLGIEHVQGPACSSLVGELLCFVAFRVIDFRLVWTQWLLVGSLPSVAKCAAVSKTSVSTDVRKRSAKKQRHMGDRARVKTRYTLSRRGLLASYYDGCPA